MRSSEPGGVFGLSCTVAFGDRRSSVVVAFAACSRRQPEEETKSEVVGKRTGGPWAGATIAPPSVVAASTPGRSRERGG